MLAVGAPSLRNGPQLQLRKQARLSNQSSWHSQLGGLCIPLLRYEAAAYSSCASIHTNSADWNRRACEEVVIANF